jgi:CrcB protein
MELKAVLAVAFGAAIGGVLRFVVTWAFVRALGPGFPYGTLFINVSGSFLIGIVAELAVTRALGVTPLVRVFTATGILGGYTTFSTFSLDALTLMGEGAELIALLYAGASVFLGVFAAYAGQVIARLAIR